MSRPRFVLPCLGLAAALSASMSPQSTRPAFAQEAVDVATIERIKAEGLERSQVLSLYNTLTNIIGPRLTGSPAHKVAAQWARDRLNGWGVQNARLEPFEFGRGWTLEKLTLEMLVPRYFPLIGYPEAWTPSTDGVLLTEPIYLGDKSAEEIEAMRDQLRGAIVLPEQPRPAFITEDRPQPATASGSVRIGAPPSVRGPGSVAGRGMSQILSDAGVGLVLEPNQGQHGTLFVLGNRNTSDDAPTTVVLASEHYNMLVRLVQSGSDVRLRAEVQTRYHEDDLNSYNVIAEIPGADPDIGDEVVMIGGHLDSWHSATGATDNADGVSAAMEAMRILRALDIQPRRTIRVALWGGEEEGLLGSRAYVDEHLSGDENQAARDQVMIYFNDDPGMGKTYGFYAEDSPEAKAAFDAWLAPLKDIGAVANVIDGIGSTDHLSFSGVGTPGFTTIKDYVDYDVRTHHTNTDFYERISEDDLKQSAIVLAAFAYQAAMRDEGLPRPEPRAGGRGRGGRGGRGGGGDLGW